MVIAGVFDGQWLAVGPDDREPGFGGDDADAGHRDACGLRGGLHRLALNPARAWRASGLVVQSDDLEIRVPDGWVFTADTADGPPLAGVEGALPMDHWPVGETLPDRRLLSLPDALPPGLYRLEVGLYDPATGDRLPIDADRGHALDGALIVDYFRVGGDDLALPPPQGGLPADLARPGERVRLLGYSLGPGPVAAGGTLDLVLYWQGQDRIGTDYTVFLHLLDGEGRTWGQGDGRPVAGFYSTLYWDPGEIVADAHRVQVDPSSPPGLYQLAVGLYELETGRRLPTADGDRLLIGSVEVR